MDFVLVYRVRPKNIVVTQDYGLEGTANNIDTLWSTTGKMKNFSKIFRAGKHKGVHQANKGSG